MRIIIWLAIFCATLIMLTYLNIEARVYADETTPKILISEIMYDPIGTDLGYEWIELYNADTIEIDISGLAIQSAGTKFTDQIILPENTKIAAHEFLTICEQYVQGCNVYINKLAFQNGGGATDAIRISFNGLVLDTVLYDKPNINSLTNDNGEIEVDTKTCNTAKSGDSLGRKNYIDTNSSQNDFIEFATPSLGASNISIDYTNSLLISEASRSLDFIEFNNVNAVNIDKWYISPEANSPFKTFLPVDTGYPLFVLNIPKEFTSNCIYLHSPDGIIQDQLCKSESSPIYSICRLTNSIEEDWEYCTPTPRLQNMDISIEFSSLHNRLNDNLSLGTDFFSKFCLIKFDIGTDLETRIAASEEYGYLVESIPEGFSDNKCYTAITRFTLQGLSIIQILEGISKASVFTTTTANPTHQNSKTEFEFVKILAKAVSSNKVLSSTNELYITDKELTPYINYQITGFLYPYSNQTTNTTKYILLTTEIAEIKTNTEATLAKSGYNFIYTSFACFIILLISVKLVRHKLYIQK